MRRLIVNPDTEDAWEIPLQPGVIALGCGPENNIPIKHPSVSDEHCLLTVTDSKVVVQDLGSKNGTFVNDVPADDTPLLVGQTLRLGDIALRLEADPHPSPSAGDQFTTVTAGAQAAFCKIHPKAVAHHHCPKCRRNFCDLCVSMRQGRTFCRACGVECEPLVVTIPEEPEPSFVSQARGAFLYPFKGDGVVLLVTGTVFFLLIDGAEFLLRFVPGYGWAVLGLLTVFGIGYLTAYLRQILTGTAMGEEIMPDWPEFTSFESVTSPLLQLIGTIAFSFGPAIALRVYSALTPGGAPWLDWATAVAMVLGCIYFPMAFLAAAMFDSIGAVNPLLIIPTILKISRQYLLTVGLLAGVLFMYWLGKTFLPEILPVPLLPAVLSGFLGLYLLTVEARVLGLLYWTNKNEFGWSRQ